jgi:hypothetical protein
VPAPWITLPLLVRSGHASSRKPSAQAAETGQMQAHLNIAADDCFARPDVAELALELATRGSSNGWNPDRSFAADARAGVSHIRANADRPTDEKQKRVHRRRRWLLPRDAVAQTLGRIQFLCICDKSAIRLQVISVAMRSIWPGHERTGSAEIALVAFV